MAHAPEWHLLDSTFQDANAGLRPPARKTSAGNARLMLTGLDRDDPPGYTPGSVPRDLTFNRNTFQLSPAPCMPAIPVTCTVEGFDPATAPILWRLFCRHVLCRHTNAGGFRYASAVDIFDREWRGESRAPAFTLFKTGCSYTYNDASRVLGGHALLIVAARLQDATLCDYAHLRIAGSNPTQSDVFRYLDERLAGYDPNILRMVRAIF